ncbi:MAG: diguanylate cyclase [Magnetococcales bacterium]|nr:diguanylate cyclase [Magnetococcales bacterium]
MMDGHPKDKILLVDNDSNDIMLLHELFAEEYEVATATNGQDALVQANLFRPDIILIEVQIPQIDGFEVCRRLKANKETQHIDIIFITLQTEAHEVTHGMTLGALDYFSKPLNLPIIKARIHSHMERIRVQRRLAVEMVRDLKAIQSRLAISALLETSLEPLSLDKQLAIALDIILTIPWLAVEYKGSIHLYNAKTGFLELYAHRNLDPKLLTICAKIGFGHCLCGMAAKLREIVFKSDLDEDHTVTFDGMKPHGHYCTPILYQNSLLGVLNLYVASGHVRSPDEEALLATLANTLAGIIRHRKTEKSLEEERLFIETILETTSALVVVLDTTGHMIRINSACEMLTGYTSQHVNGKLFWDTSWTESKEVEKVQEILLQAASNPATIAFESQWISKTQGTRHISWNLSVLLNAQGDLINFIATGIDVTERHLAEKTLERLAHHDALTGLPNRRLFGVFLQQAVARCQRHNCGLAVMFMDLDRFKAVNDGYGHDVGDLLLTEAARRIHDCLRENDVVARLGGDEFTIILSDTTRQTKIIGLVAQRIIDSLRVPFHLLEHTCQIGASIGISVFPDDADNPDQLLKMADTALYAVKKGGRNHFLMYHPSMDAEGGKT